jgi:hypothetical protein
MNVNLPHSNLSNLVSPTSVTPTSVQNNGRFALASESSLHYDKKFDGETIQRSGARFRVPLDRV